MAGVQGQRRGRGKGRRSVFGCGAGWGRGWRVGGREVRGGGSGRGSGGWWWRMCVTLLVLFMGLAGGSEWQGVDGSVPCGDDGVVEEGRERGW